MDFFKSVFADDPDPPSPESDPESSSEIPNPQDFETLTHGSQSDSNPTTPSAIGGGTWSFGGLIKTLTTKSESVIETYKRDLQEFGSGLKKETEVIREVASRTVKDLPSSLEIGASKAQGSLESVGQAIDSIGSVVWKSTAEIIAQGKDSLLSADDSDSSDLANDSSSSSNLNAQAVNSGRYSRFDAQLNAIQCDVNTYIEVPEDVNEYDKWKESFNLEEQDEEIGSLMRENVSMEGIYKRVVPNTVDHETFWYRYYYRVHRLKQAEFVRASLVKRAISTQDDEELSWDVDDDDDEVEVEEEKKTVVSRSNDLENKEAGKEGEEVEVEEEQKTVVSRSNDLENKEAGKEGDESQARSSLADVSKSEVTPNMEGEKKGDVIESHSEIASNEAVYLEENSDANEAESLKKAEEKAPSEGKAEPSESGKDSDISVVSSQTPEEEDLGWDEIEDIESGDEKKLTQIGSPNRVELRQRLSADVEDEDLSWDIEDDDEPIKH